MVKRTQYKSQKADREMGGVNAYSQSDDQVKIRFSCVKLIMAVLRDILESVYMWLSWLTQSKVRPFSTVQNANGMVNGMVQDSPSTVTYRFTSSVHCGAVLIRTPRVDSSRICKHVNIAAKRGSPLCKLFGAEERGLFLLVDSY